MNFEVKAIPFDEISQVWSADLWPGRVSDIEPVSAISFSGEIDGDILKQTPTHFGAFGDGERAGVISGHLTTSESYRMRGIFVYEKFRKQGVGLMLVNHQILQARKERAHFIWGLIRVKNYPFFKKLCFQKIIEISKYEFGPHYIVRKDLL